jgi:transcriptional regulator with XRE-family HTH domain
VTRGKFLRLLRGLTQHQLAASTHINRVTIANIENRRVIPTDRERSALARALGCSPDRLLDYIDESSLGGAQREASHG